jgi:hypothetical protein
MLAAVSRRGAFFAATLHFNFGFVAVAHVGPA